MTEPRLDGPFEVPVRGLSGGPSHGRRGIVVAVALVAAVGAAFGLARLSGGDRSAAGTAAPEAARASPAGSPGASSGASPGGRGSTRIERLLDIPDRAIAGSPDVAFTMLDGRDIRFAAWHPGSGLAGMGSVPGVLGPDEPVAFPILAPTGARSMIVMTGDDGGSASGGARIVNGLGRTIWTGEDIAFASGGLWQEDGTLAVVAGNGRSWHLVSIEGSGSTRSRAVDLIVDLPGEVFLPLPVPNGSITIPRIAPRTVPVGFSADGRWIYGGVISPELGILIGEFRVRIDGGRVERVADFGVGREDGLLPRPGTIGGHLVDPATGRLANWRVNADTTGGPPTLEVRNADKSFAFAVDVPALLGSAWGGDGSLYVLAADAPLFADRVTLSRVAPDGSLEPPLLETGSVTGASLVDGRDGYGAIVVWASGTRSASQIVLVDLADPSRVSALTLPAGGGVTIIGGELRPPTPAASPGGSLRR